MNHAWIKYFPSWIRLKMEGRYNLQKAIANTGWLFADKFLHMSVGLVVGVWIARYLGPEQYGVFNYAVAFVALFTALATVGLDNIVVRDIVREPAGKEETLGTAFVLKLIGGTTALLINVGLIFLIRSQDPLMHWLIGITAAGMIFQAFDVIGFWFQSQVQSKYTVYAKDAAFLLIAAVKVALILLHAPLIAFAWASLTEIAVGALGLIVVYRINGQRLRAWRTSLVRAKTLFSDSWPLILSGLAIMVYMRIDQIMLGEMIGQESVGIYSAAVRLSEVWYFIPMIIVSSVFPSIVEAKQISEKLYHERITRLFTLMTSLAYAIAIPMTFLSDRVVTLLYGAAYIESGTILTIHIWTGLFVFLGVARSSWIITEGLMRFSFAMTAIGAIVNVLLNLVLIKRYGAIGAAVSTVIAQFFASYAANAFYPKTRRIFVDQTKALILSGLFKRSDQSERRQS